MRNICFYFQVHQPFRLKRYRFFDLGNDHYYYDDYLNKHILKKVANRCYLPTNELLYNLIKENELFQNNNYKKGRKDILEILLFEINKYVKFNVVNI